MSEDPSAFCTAYGCPEPVTGAVHTEASFMGPARTAHYCAEHIDRLRAEGYDRNPGVTIEDLT